jgi:hypothetical protein
MKKKLVEKAQERLAPTIAQLGEVEKDLRRVVSSLPTPSGQEEADAESDEATEVRAVVECVLRDCIEPAVRDLRAAAAYRAKSLE